jgi:hypothetical protein
VDEHFPDQIAGNVKGGTFVERSRELHG